MSLNLEQSQARKLADDDFKKTMDAERDRLAKANYPSRVVKLDSVLKTEAADPKPVAAASATPAEDADADAPDADGQAKFDIHLRETLRVVGDALRLNQNSAYSADGRTPFTAAVLPKG